MSSTASKPSRLLSTADFYPYQARLADRLYEWDETLVLVQPGGGKTAPTATAYGELIDDGVLRRVLIVAPKRVALSVWPSEFRHWQQLQRYSLNVAVGDPMHRAKAFEEDSHFVVTNWENLPWAYKSGHLKGFDGIILDEVSFAQNYSAGRSRTLQKVLRDFKVRCGLTGSPGNIKRMYAMVKAVDRGRRLGMTWTPYRNEYYVKTGPNDWDWEEKDGAMDAVLDRISDLCFMIDDSEYEDTLPPLVNTDIIVELPAGVRNTYDDMEADLVVSLDGKPITEEEIDELDLVVAANRGVVTGKLQQIADGFLYRSGRPADGHARLHQLKLDAVKERVREAGEPCIVVYKFQETLAWLKKTWPDAPVLSSGVSDKRTLEIIDEWNERRHDVMFIHPQSAGHGLNLQLGGNRLIFLSTPWSREYYEQTIRRLQRPGQQASQVFVDHILAANTIDYDIAQAQIERASIQEALMEGLRRRTRCR